MASRERGNQTRFVGYGSSYRKGAHRDLGREGEIGTVLGGHVWLVKPEKKARSAHPCLWQRAGVVTFKGCNNYYDCVTCKYDQGMRRQVEKGKQISWQDAMRTKPDLQRVCRHSLTNRIDRRVCAHDYRCSKCDFDQFFEDVWSAKTKSWPTEIEQIRGFDVPMNHYFHSGHTWARIESGGTIRIGLDDFALKLFGKADGLELPLMGNELDQGCAGWGLKRKGNNADVLSPVGGVIMDVNAKVRRNPECANREPYGDGWLFTVRNPNIKKSVQNLMADTSTMDWMETEVDMLESMIEEVAGPLVADGGFLQEDIYGNLPDLGWRSLTKTFLKT